MTLMVNNMPADTRKAWVVRLGVLPGRLEEVLNTLEQDSYQVFKIEWLESSFVVIACDPSLIGRRQGEALAKAMGLFQQNMGVGVPAPPARTPL